MSNDISTTIGNPSFADIDGLSIRYAKGGSPDGIPILFTSPWPESFYSFHRVVPVLEGKHPFIMVDLPGFGHSQSRPDVMAPEAMGDFMLSILSYFGVDRVHVVAPDVGTPAVLFSALKKPALFRTASRFACATSVRSPPPWLVRSRVPPRRSRCGSCWRRRRAWSFRSTGAASSACF